MPDPYNEHKNLGIPMCCIPEELLEAVQSLAQISRPPSPSCTFLSLQVQIYNPAFFKYIHDRWTEHHGRYPSTGMLVLFFALHVCDEVGSRCCLEQN
jgi:beta-galactoside alpha-2,3-sialyltransferase (sialyltransferase 4B)